MKKQYNKNEDLPEFLRELQGENPFVTPHNYFRELPDQIMQRLHEETRETPQRSIFEMLQLRLQALLTPQPAWALALVVVVAAVFFFDRETPHEFASVGNEMSTEEIATYVKSNIDDFDEFDFYVTETAEIDILGETLESLEVESLMDGLMDEMDLETLQRIL